METLARRLAGSVRGNQDLSAECLKVWGYRQARGLWVRNKPVETWLREEDLPHPTVVLEDAVLEARRLNLMNQNYRLMWNHKDATLEITLGSYSLLRKIEPPFNNEAAALLLSRVILMIVEGQMA